jgi:hypothetical protein
MIGWTDWHTITEPILPWPDIEVALERYGYRLSRITKDGAADWKGSHMLWGDRSSLPRPLYSAEKAAIDVSESN